MPVQEFCLRIMDILGQGTDVGAALYMAGCLAAPLASTH